MKHIYRNRISLLIVAIFVPGLILANCGGPAKKEISVAPGDTTTIKNDVVIAEHRAFDHFSKGDLYERSGNLEKAADEYRLALFYDPTSDELKRSLATVLYDLQRYSEALEVAVQITDQSVNDQLLVASCYHGLGNIKKTIECYETIAAGDSVPQGVIEDLAKYYVFQKNQDKVEKYYKWLIENGDNPNYWRSDLASAYVKLDKPKKAEEIFRSMIKADSLDWGAYLGLAGVAIVDADTATADSLYSFVANNNWDSGQMLTILLPALLDIVDDDMALKVARRITELFPQDYLSLRRYGILLFTVGNTATADSVFSNIIESVADDPVSLYYMGRIAQQNREYPKAESLYCGAVAADDSLVEGWINLAFVRGLQDNFDGAMATFDSALIYGPADSAQILFYTGTYLSGQQHFTEAIDYYLRVLNINPNNPDAEFSLAAAYERTGEYNKAEQLFLRLLRQDKDNPVVMNYLGYMYADQGIKLKEAQKLIKKALKIDPDNGAYLDSYAWVMYKMKKYKEALKYQLLALKSNQGDDAILFEHMGDIYLALDKPQEATSHWEKALELDPNNESVKDKLQR